MRFSRSARLAVEDLGRADYAALEARMLAVVDEVLAGGDDRLLVAEPEPVLTVGRGARVADYAAPGSRDETQAGRGGALLRSTADADSPLPVVAVSRGGKATWHGPGQLVVWPVIALRDEARDLHAYLHALEDALILALARLGFTAGRDPRNTGAWIDGRKVASIGVAVRRWVAYHGVALNLTTDLAVFRRFDPCGLEPGVMTTLEHEAGTAPDAAQVRAALLAALHETLRDGEQAKL